MISIKLRLEILERSAQASDFIGRNLLDADQSSAGSAVQNEFVLLRRTDGLDRKLLQSGVVQTCACPMSQPTDLTGFAGYARTACSAFAAASIRACGPTTLPVAFSIHRSGVRRPSVVMRSTSSPRLPVSSICCSI